MSKSGEDGSHAAPQPKRRRVRGACDICRKQKARCDSANMPGNRCSNCVAFQSECTHIWSKSRNAKEPSNLIDSTRTAPEHVTHILSGSLEYTSSDSATVYQIMFAVAQYARRLEEALATASDLPLSSNQISPPSAASLDSAGTESESEDDGVLMAISEPLSRIAIDISSNRYYGVSSSINFLKTSRIGIKAGTGHRPDFWSVQPWQQSSTIFVPHLFPEQDLMDTLVDAYFTQINPLIFLLHAPTFRRAVAGGLHLHNERFGQIVLVVCALGAKYSNDPRVFLDDANSEHTAGWKWFRQIPTFPTSFITTPSLHDLQLLCLRFLYITSSSISQESWAMIGLGVRMAQDAGAHRRIRSNSGDLESEMFKRVFWLLYAADIILSCLFGRPRCTSASDIDIDLPVVLEDEENINVDSYLPLFLQLIEIWARVQREIYPVKRKGHAYQEVVAELDSALNQWVDSIPPELRWDPNCADLITLNQSACMYGLYYHAQIRIHRAFIPSPGNQLSSTTFPSLAICANAARSCAHVLDVQCKRTASPLYNPQMIVALADSAFILLLNVYSRRSRLSTDFSVQKCLNVLRLYERRWQLAGRHVDIISGMIEADDEPLDSLKRTWDPEDGGSSSIIIPDEFSARRNLAGSKRVAAVVPPDAVCSDQVTAQEIERMISLPIHTAELGQLPIYDSFDFDFMFPPDTTYLVSDPTANPFLENQSAAGDLTEAVGGGDWQEWNAYLTNVEQ
ncbi:fungal-specific transcription factor domain-containing protein [Mycena rebaudengoi]|nr:fungal-specific transcription factor domain-containing protein [Mycena rebaudengoi]